jgi:hypothetical protein
VAHVTVVQVDLVDSAQDGGRKITPRAKFCELFLLGLIIGVFSFGLSWLWKGYEHKASDFIQYVYAEVGPKLAVKYPDSLVTWILDHVFGLKALENRMVIIDIDEQICDEWAKDKYGGLCAALPRLPHSRLKELFQRLAQSRPKLVVVDIDLRSEEPTSPGSDLFDPDVSQFNKDEQDIRDIVKSSMKDVPFLVAQPLIKEPKGAYEFDYVAAPTVLHKLDKTNLRFGHVEQDLRDIYTDDGVLRRFPATLQINFSPPSVNPRPPCPGLVEHLALRVCEPDLGLPCKKPSEAPEMEDHCGTGLLTTALRFADISVPPDGYVQFRYSFGRHPERLANWNVRLAKALDFDIPTLDDAIVVLGSTARGRGDYHFTPLDVGGGETPGVIVVANEVAAALEGKWLVEPHLGLIGVEKFVFVLISTVIVFFGYWRPQLLRPAQISSSMVKTILVELRSVTRLFSVIAVAVLINFLLGWFISFHIFKSGQVVDPVTPVIAVILDGLVDLCYRVSSWFD